MTGTSRDHSRWSKIKLKLKHGKNNMKGTLLESLAFWRSEKEKLPIEEVYKVPLTITRYLGLHIAWLNYEGEYVVSRKGLIPMIICSIVCLLALVPPGVMLIFMEPPYWLVVMLVPYILGYSFCIFTYLQTLVNAKKMVKYMEAIRPLRIKGKLTIPVFLLWIFFYPVVLTAAAMVMLNGYFALMFMLPIMLVAFIPATLDVYMASFMAIFHKSLNDLAEAVRERDDWASEDVQHVTNRWMFLSKLSISHNEIFSLRLHLRVILLMTQTMSFLFIVWGMTRYEGMCIIVLLFNLIPLFEVNARFLGLCKMGESVINASDDLTRAVTVAMYQIDASSPEHFSLAALAARLEARPISIENWGMDRLSAKTFVSLSSVIITYLVVLLQFCDRSARLTDVDNGIVFTWFDNCFCVNDTLVNATYFPWAADFA